MAPKRQGRGWFAFRKTLSQEVNLTIVSRFKPTLAASLVALAASLVAGQALAQEAKPESQPRSRVPALRAAQEDSRVFGGHEAAKGAWPFQVALLSSQMLDDSPESQPDAQFCGGSLIAPGWVLTAAHCLMDGDQAASPDVMTVLTGATHLAEGTRHKAAAIFVNPAYSPMTFDNDIGLIKLADGAAEPTVKIAEDGKADDGDATVIGWGMMEDGTFPNDLMEVTLKMFPISACNAGIKDIYAKDLSTALKSLAARMRFPETVIETATPGIVAAMGDPLTGNMICAGETSGERDACNGDSGGPLFVKNGDDITQVGIVSWGEGPMDAGAACGHENAYGVYTRLGNYKDWIAETIAANGGPGEPGKPGTPDDKLPPNVQKPGDENGGDDGGNDLGIAQKPKSGG
jgi:secreted trypsin-like serine protease